MGAALVDGFAQGIAGEVFRIHARIEGGAAEIDGIGSRRDGSIERVRRAAGREQLGKIMVDGDPSLLTNIS